MAKQLGFEAINLEESASGVWVHLETQDSYWAKGFILPALSMKPHVLSRLAA
jgi:hypothetical protein